MPGISMHTELELPVRLGRSPREALAAATSNGTFQARVAGTIHLAHPARAERRDNFVRAEFGPRREPMRCASFIVP
jgi:hypothetical protein